MEDVKNALIIAIDAQVILIASHASIVGLRPPVEMYACIVIYLIAKFVMLHLCALHAN